MIKRLWYGVLAVGMLLISSPVWAQGLFPGLEIRDMSQWFLTFFVAAVFSIMWWMIRRWIGFTDELRKSVDGLTLETRLHRQEAGQYSTDINILKRRVNRHTDWMHRHNKIHARCPSCPEIENDLNEAEK